MIDDHAFVEDGGHGGARDYCLCGKPKADHAWQTERELELGKQLREVRVWLADTEGKPPDYLPSWEVAMIARIDGVLARRPT